MFKPGENYNGYSIDKIIYKNRNCSCIIFTSCLENGKKVAVKCLSNQHFRKQINNEMRFFRSMKFKQSKLNDLNQSIYNNLIQCYDIFKTKTRTCFVLEYAQYGDLYQYVSKRSSIDEEDVKNIMLNVFKAVQCLHNNDFCHHDIKLENVFLLDEGNTAVLADFGSTSRIREGEKSDQVLGSPLYLPPEVLEMKPHDRSLDLWSLGVTMFVLLTGEMPFIGNSAESLLNNIHKVIEKFDELPALKNVSTEGKSLLSKLLKLNPNERITIDEALKDSWFDSVIFNEGKLVNLPEISQGINESFKCF